jgi:SAM-dependent methyltransferase
LASHYPVNYLAYADAKWSPKSSLVTISRSVLKAAVLRAPWFRKLWLNSRSTQDWLATKPDVALYVRLLNNADARILDVGCGQGRLVRQLREIGFRAAQGVDPFVDTDTMHHGTTLVRKAFLSEMTGSFDCIAFHHSLEHMPNQVAVLRDAHRLLAPGGIILVRIPVADGEAWRTYRENWVQLDPPRHFYLHSRISLRLLADQCGLRIRSIACDSTGFQFWGSEQYLRDIPLTDPRSSFTPGPSVFTEVELAEYDRLAAQLNATDDGDQIVAILEAGT